MINETYSAFVQGFMPTLARPEVDVLEGLTTAIIVDQERMGADPRSTVGTATHANAMLRILFSLRQPHIGSPNAFSFNVASVRASGAITVERGNGKTVRATFNRTGGMCPRCEGRGSVTDFDLSALYDDSKSLSEGRSRSPASAWTAGTAASTAAAVLRPGQADPRVHQDRARGPAVQGADQDQGRRRHLTYEGLIPRIQKSFLSKDVDALQPHIRAFVGRAIMFAVCPDCGGPGSARRLGRRGSRRSTSPTPA